MFDLLIKTPITNLLLLFYQFLGENLGLSIILLTIFIRLLMLPLTIRQIRFQKKMAELQPKLQQLQANRKDAKEMSMEEMALMRQTAGSCLTGCLPFLIQIPIFLGLYSVINTIASSSTGDVFNNVVYFDFLKQAAEYRFNTDFLGFDLAGVPSKIGLGINFIPYGILLALLVATQVIQNKMMTFAQNKKKVEDEKGKANQKKLTQKEREKLEQQEEMQKMMQLQMKYMIPVFIGIASYTFSAALSVYWLTQNIFAIIQMYIQNNWNEKRGLIDNLLNLKRDNVYKVAEYRDVIEENVKTADSDKNQKKKKKKKKHKK